jgi:hypothetical protein
MPRPKSTTAARRTPAASTGPAPAKTAGLDRNMILLAALALADSDGATSGSALIPWAAYGKAMGLASEIVDVTVEPGANGMEISVQWIHDDEDTDGDPVAFPGHSEVQVADAGASARWNTMEDWKDASANA